MSWPAPARITRAGRYVDLEPLNAERDIADLYELSHTPPAYQALWAYMANGPYDSQAAMLEWLRRAEASPEQLYHTVTSRAHGRRVGVISIMSIEPAHGRAELGAIWYSPLVHRSMVNTEVTYLLLRYLFEDLGYRRVEWKCNSENEASKAAALRMGFRYEGLFRQHMIVKGRNRDTAWYAMLDSEWPARRAAFERYLSGEPGLSLRALNQAEA